MTRVRSMLVARGRSRCVVAGCGAVRHMGTSPPATRAPARRSSSEPAPPATPSPTRNAGHDRAEPRRRLRPRQLQGFAHSTIQDVVRGQIAYPDPNPEHRRTPGMPAEPRSTARRPRTSPSTSPRAPATQVRRQARDCRPAYAGSTGAAAVGTGVERRRSRPRPRDRRRRASPGARTARGRPRRRRARASSSGPPGWVEITSSSGAKVRSASSIACSGSPSPISPRASIPAARIAVERRLEPLAPRRAAPSSSETQCLSGELSAGRHHEHLASSRPRPCRRSSARSSRPPTVSLAITSSRRSPARARRRAPA